MDKIVIGSKRGKTRVAIGKNLETKINFIVGTNSDDKDAIKIETNKIDLAVRLGVHTITDLSMARLRRPLWNYVKEKYPHVAVGLNPPYLLFKEDNQHIFPRKLLAEIKKFVENGLDFMTINFFPRDLNQLKYAKKRLILTTSRQGGMILKYMIKNKAKNPYWEILDDLLDLLKENNVTINIGSTFRPAGIYEAYDSAHLWEIRRQMAMHRRLDKKGIQSLVETMSHQPLDEIGKGILNLRKKYGGYVPFQFLGPIVTDIGSGEYDYVSSAIGTAEAARYNVGKVTVIPAYEHTAFPKLDDIRKGVIATKIGVHAGDLTRIKSLMNIDEKILQLRAKNKSCNPFSKSPGCNKCGKYCPLTLV